MKIRSKRSFAVLIALMLGLPVCAHETWLLTHRDPTQAAGDLILDMTSGERFPSAGTGIARERVGVSTCRQAGSMLPLMPVKRLKTVLQLVVRSSSKAPLMCWVGLHPRELVLAHDKIALYLDEIDASPAIREAWAGLPAPKRWQETYTKNAKVIVPSPAGSTDTTMAEPVGMPLEFVPDTDLSTGSLAGLLRTRVLSNGQPVRDISVTLHGEHHGSSTRQRTNAEGRVEFAAPGPGRWMLSTTDLHLVDAREGKWASQFATLTFTVLQSAQRDR